ncbi:hypothetical protein [Yersinia aldovae]|uniref:hypothetical protein n=1 Tax=Yersinia aldovae TaxID=29483 RepID=UPI00119D770A|nr:hypothetical protein [Yersinia aldovae]
MSMTIIDHGPSITETQLHSMLTGDLKGATKLEGWDAFKNFFIKLLNNLPGMSLVDKEDQLREIYDKIYGAGKTAQSVDDPGSIETTWNALENLFQLMDEDKSRQMTLAINYASSHNESSHSSHMQNADLIKLTLTIDGHQIPDIACSNTPLNTGILASIVSTYMIDHVDSEGKTHAGTFQLNPEVLEANGNRVAFGSVAKLANQQSISVVKELNLCHEFLHTNMYDNTEFDKQLEQVYQCQQLVANLQALRSPPDTPVTANDKCIDNALDKLNQRRDKQQSLFEKINHTFVNAVVEKWSEKLEQVAQQPLNKTEINTEMSYLEAALPGTQTLFSETDRKRIADVRPQLRLAHMMADLQARIKDSSEFPVELFLSIRDIMVQEDNGPLSVALDNCWEQIKQQHLFSTDSYRVTADAQQPSNKVIRQRETMEQIEPLSKAGQFPG